jgi:predicted LPLAT superfamily acyltransferase
MKREAKKRGNALGFWFFKTSLRLFGLSGAYGLLYPVCLYYLIFDHTAVSSSMAYIKRRFKEYNIFQRIFAVYRLFINQGKNLIDRFYIVSGLGEFDIEICGYDRIESLLRDKQKGVIILTAHVGNWQVTMTALERWGRTVYLLMTPEENAAVKNSLNIDSERGKIKIISSKNSVEGVFEVMKVLKEGNVVSIMGDRSYEYDSMEAYLFGEKAVFPYGAFSIAAAAQCPIIVLLSAKVSQRKYIVYISNIIEPRYVSRSQRLDEIKACVQKFARVLEGFAKKYPFQWFVFYDIWEEKTDKKDILKIKEYVDAEQ